MNVFGQLVNAQIENKTSDYSVGVAGRLWFNLISLKYVCDDGTLVRALLRNDSHCVFGSSGTASNNIRFHRGANQVLQFVSGADVTAEGTLSTVLNKLSFKFETYTSGTLPAAGNAGRVAYVSDTGVLQYDNGAIWGGLGASDSLVTKTADYVALISDDDILVDASAGAVQITLPLASALKAKKLRIKKIDITSNPVNIIRASSDLLDGETVQTYIAPMTAVTWISDGVSNWFGF